MGIDYTISYNYSTTDYAQLSQKFCSGRTAIVHGYSKNSGVAM